MVKHSVFGGLLSTGASIVDIGVCTTPTATIILQELGAAGGIVISASHNPAQWNALKFFRSDGIYLNEEEMRTLFDIYYQGEFVKAAWNEFQAVETNGHASEAHVEKVLSILDCAAIRKAGLRVALDCCNGAGVHVSAIFLSELGIEPEKIHCVPDGMFPHDPEPTFVNLQDLCEHVKGADVHVGFAQDPDADRLAIVSENGEFIGEEYTLGLAEDYVLARSPGTVVTNISTSRLIDDVARKHGCPAIRVPVGEVNVAERMKDEGSPIGGEGNGGVIDPRVHYGRDSLVAMGLVLELLAGSGRKLSEIVAELPRYHQEKIKVDCERLQAREVLRRIRDEQRGEKIDLTDGVKIDWEDSWIHLRPSNTEPVLRIIAEGKTKIRARELTRSFESRIRKMLSEVG
jgi:phosphomannomutase